MVNVIRQLARPEFKDGEGFKNVCIHAQKLQSRLLLAGEAESEPPFNVMFVNGLPERIDFFALQECFIPVGSFAELWTTPINYEDGRSQWEGTFDNHAAMAIRKQNKVDMSEQQS